LRLVVDYLEGSLSVATWDDTAWIGGTASGTIYRSVVLTDERAHDGQRHDEDGGQHVAQRQRDEEVVEHRSEFAFSLHRRAHQHVSTWNRARSKVVRSFIRKKADMR